MKQVIKEAMGDCSTIGDFRFLLRCQECGRTWHSSPVRFSKAGTEPETEGMRAVFRTLYERERAAAREKAAAEASEIFSQCPVCGRLVCDRCFLICEIWIYALPARKHCRCAAMLWQEKLPLRGSSLPNQPEEFQQKEME